MSFDAVVVALVTVVSTNLIVVVPIKIADADNVVVAIDGVVIVIVDFTVVVATVISKLAAVVNTVVIVDIAFVPIFLINIVTDIFNKE